MREAVEERPVVKCYFTVGIFRPSGIQDPLQCFFYRNGYCLNNPRDFWIHSRTSEKGSILYCYGFKDKEASSASSSEFTIKKCNVPYCHNPRYRVEGKKPYLSRFCEDHFKERRRTQSRERANKLPGNQTRDAATGAKSKDH